MSFGFNAKATARTLCLVAAPLVALAVVRLIAPLPQVTKASGEGGSDAQSRASLSLPPEIWRSAVLPPFEGVEAMTGSPFYLPTPLGEVDIDAPMPMGEWEDTSRPPVQSVVVVPHLRLTSILLIGERQMAIIDGKTVKRGDEVAKGWHLEAINGRSQTIIIRHPSGGEHVLGIWRSDGTGP